MAYRIIYRPHAANSLDRIERYLSARSPNGARNVLLEIRRTIALLAEYPNAGRSIEGMDLWFHITRRYKYRLIYRVRGDTLQIM